MTPTHSLLIARTMFRLGVIAGLIIATAFQPTPTDTAAVVAIGFGVIGADIAITCRRHHPGPSPTTEPQP